MIFSAFFSQGKAARAASSAGAPGFQPTTIWRPMILRAVGHVARRDQHQPPAAEQSGVEGVGGVEMDRVADHQQIGFGGVEGDIGLDLAFVVAPGDRRRAGVERKGIDRLDAGRANLGRPFVDFAQLLDFQLLGVNQRKMESNPTWAAQISASKPRPAAAAHCSVESAVSASGSSAQM